MERIVNELSHLVNKHFSMHPARLTCFLALILSVIGAKSVQLWPLAEQFGGDALIESRVKRIKRFLQQQVLCLDIVAQLIMMLLSPSGPLILAIDRTNWSFGKIERNYLVLSLVFHGSAVPILFTDLGRAGNSDYQDRIDIISRFIRLFGREAIFCLLADREFVGIKWFQWTQSENIPIYIRQKSNMQVRHKNGGKVPVSRLLQSLNIGEKREWIETLYGVKMKMVGVKLGSGDYLILLASQEIKADLLPLYKVRWTIECVFKNTKSSGFNMELTHLKHPDRAEKMMGVLSIAVAISIKEGAIQNRLRPISIKKTIRYKAVSIFSYGFRYIADQLRRLCDIISNPFIYKDLLKSVP